MIVDFYVPEIPPNVTKHVTLYGKGVWVWENPPCHSLKMSQLGWGRWVSMARVTMSLNMKVFF